MSVLPGRGCGQGQQQGQPQTTGVSLKEEDHVPQSFVVMVARLCEDTKPLNCTLETETPAASELFLKAVIKNHPGV